MQGLIVADLQRPVANAARLCQGGERCATWRSKSEPFARPTMKTRAAVAFAPKQPLEIVELDLEGPKAGEVLVEIMATGICHTDAYTLDGLDSEGIFPSVLGHEGAGIVREVGAGVTSVKPGDHVIPLYTPECRQCKSCLSRQDQPVHRDPRDAGQGADARRDDAASATRAEPIFHYMGCSTFSNFTVLPEIAVAKIREDAPFQTSCYIGCGVTTGVGAVVNTAKVQVGDNVVVFGLGGIGLNVVQGARLAGREQDHRRRPQPRPRGVGPAVRDDRLPQHHGHEPRRDRGEDRRDDRRRRGLHLRLHRQHRGDAHRARGLPPRLGHLDRHRRRRSRARKSPPARSSWSPAATGAAPRSAGPRAAPTCPRSSTGTWTARSRSTR